ncbi:MULTISPECIES: tetratricopeptide repeat protein [Vibrio]|uniref:tetratricopeptide repeat protein n=1 Tax=Vibrio TaxID=662 RepID=UPI001F02DDFF|nr:MULTISPECIES: tetratricopeptide repeat protein [Vibrio]MCF7496483.1 tetratricopeptide repeat protein [Vibrio sp. L5-1]MDH5918445.1 tetratricopeptide repeat protein [Vibrio splendidus]
MKKAVLALTIALSCSSVFAASIDKANLLSEHGLHAQAKEELIDVIFSKSNSKVKAKAYYELGNISFENNQVSPALSSWKKLVEIYPSSPEAKIVKGRLEELSQIVGENAQESVDNAIAASYLKHADFWSDDRANTFIIDSSWIPKVEAANKWYDKVIVEFPNSKASRIAHEEKLRTLLGWEERGKYGSSYGVKRDFGTYMPQVLETFASLENEFPNAPTLQAFRYQIAQAYWSAKQWDNTRKWLNSIIEKSNGKDNFYKDAAERRLKKVEY